MAWILGILTLGFCLILLCLEKLFPLSDALDQAIVILILITEFVNIALISKIYYYTKSTSKNIIIWFKLSIFAFIAVEILYYIVYSTPHKIGLIFVFDVFHLAYYIVTAIFFSSLLIKYVLRPKRFLIILLIIVILNIGIFSVFSIDTHYLVGHFSIRNTIQIIQSTIDMIIFSLAFLWLIFSRNPGTSFIAAGYITCTSSEFMMTSCYMSNEISLLTWAQLSWLLGLLLIMSGMLLIVAKKNYNVKDWLITRSIKTRLIFDIFALITISIIIFFLIIKNFSIVSDSFYIFSPTIIMNSTLIIALFARIIGRAIDKPLLQIQNDIENSLLSKETNLIEDALTLEDSFRYGEIKKIEVQIKAVIAYVNKQSNDAAFGIIARKVSHNIKSPLTTLESCKNELRKVGGANEKLAQQIGIAIDNIKYTLFNLLNINEESKYLTQDDSNKPRYILLKPLINEIVNQKTIEWGNKCELIYNDKLINKNIWLFTLPCEFKNNISNLLNNSFESFKTGLTGIVQLSLLMENNSIIFKITDNGAGIEKDILPKVKSGFSTKLGGQGIGLSSAIEYFDKLGGSLTFPLTNQVGTSIDICIPDIPLPNWLPSSIKLTNYIVILDDSITTHTYLQTVFSRIETVKYFTKIKEFTEWINSHQGVVNNVTFFIDHQLDDDVEKGIDIIERYNIATTSYLLTNEYNNQIIQERATYHNIKIIPKSLMHNFLLREY